MRRAVASRRKPSRHVAHELTGAWACRDRFGIDAKTLTPPRSGDRIKPTALSDLESGPWHSRTSPFRILMHGKGTVEGLQQLSASASLRAVKKKSKRKGRSDRNHWFFFRGGEPAHRIGSRSETQLLTACGLHFHPLTATPMQQGCNGPKCQTCVRARP